MKYEIPKEIKAKPKIVGLEMRELVILLTGSLLLLTIFRELVHSVFVIPYFVVAIAGMIYLFLPSASNPKKKHYEAILLFFRHKKGVFHAMDTHKQQNVYVREELERSEKRSESDGPLRIGKR